MGLATLTQAAVQPSGTRSSRGLMLRRIIAPLRIGTTSSTPCRRIQQHYSGICKYSCTYRNGRIQRWYQSALAPSVLDTHRSNPDNSCPIINARQSTHPGLGRRDTNLGLDTAQATQLLIARLFPLRNHAGNRAPRQDLAEKKCDAGVTNFASA